MSMIAYADVTLPECYLASRPADGLRCEGMEAEWCALDVQLRLDVLSRRLSPAAQDELPSRVDLFTALVQPATELPWAMPAAPPPSKAEASAYAEALGAKARDNVRRLLFAMCWFDGLCVKPGAVTTSAYQRIRTWQAQWEQLNCPPLPGVLAVAAAPHGLDAMRGLGKEPTRVGAAASLRVPEVGGRSRPCYQFAP